MKLESYILIESKINILKIPVDIFGYNLLIN